MIPEPVRFQATNVGSAGPEPLPELGGERLADDRLCLVLGTMPTVNMVEALRLEPEGVEGAVAEVRAHLRRHGRSQAAWCVGPSSAPADLEERLAALGMTPYLDPPLEPSYSAMALVSPPGGEPAADVVARRVESLEEMVMVASVQGQAFALSEADRQSQLAVLRRRFELEQEGRVPGRQYLAFASGEPVGAASGLLLDAGINLSGGAVLPAARGRGVYRALVEARWRDAVARGTPALTVQAGRMSKPILERLGFVTVAEVAVLCDRF